MRATIRHIKRSGLVPAVVLALFGGRTAIHFPTKDYLYQEVYYLIRAAEESDNPGKVFQGT